MRNADLVRKESRSSKEEELVELLRDSIRFDSYSLGIDEVSTCTSFFFVSVCLYIDLVSLAAFKTLAEATCSSNRFGSKPQIFKSSQKELIHDVFRDCMGSSFISIS